MNELVVENNYKPSEKAQLFHSSNARVIVLVGGLGSGKSYSVVKEIEQSAIQWEKMPIAVYRKTMPALRDSTLHEFKSHSDTDIGEYKAREDKWIYKNGSFVNFRGLDDPTKAKSTNYAMVVMEEAEEFTRDDFQRLNERVRATGPWPHRIILVLNPVDEDHWIYKEFVDNAKVYRDNGGLLVLHFSTYDNLENLPEGYVAQASAGKTPDEIDRYIHGKWGSVIKGEPVYAKILHPTLHLRVMDRFPGQTLLRGWDFGFNHPAVSFRLVDSLNRMNIAHVIMGEKVDLPEFVPRIISSTHTIFGSQVQIQDFGDPRGHDKGQNGKGSCFEVLQDFGIHATGERGSRDYLEEGIRHVKREFSTLIESVPMLTIDPSCRLIRTAYFGRYVRDEDGNPKKDGYYEHVADADRYISHHHRNNNAIQVAMQKRRSDRAARISNATGYRRIR
jgi:phage terminase large subunit